MPMAITPLFGGSLDRRQMPVAAEYRLADSVATARATRGGSAQSGGQLAGEDLVPKLVPDSSELSRTP